MIFESNLSNTETIEKSETPVVEGEGAVEMTNHQELESGLIDGENQMYSRSVRGSVAKLGMLGSMAGYALITAFSAGGSSGLLKDIPKEDIGNTDMSYTEDRYIEEGITDKSKSFDRSMRLVWNNLKEYGEGDAEQNRLAARDILANLDVYYLGHMGDNPVYDTSNLSDADYNHLISSLRRAREDYMSIVNRLDKTEEHRGDVAHLRSSVSKFDTVISKIFFAKAKRGISFAENK